MTGWQQVLGPGFDFVEDNVESWGNDTTFVEAAVQVDNDFTSSVIIDNFKFANVAVLHHDGQELNNDLGAWSQQDLTLVSLLGVGDGL